MIIFAATLIITSALNLFFIGQIHKKDYRSVLHSELLVLGDNLKTQLKRITLLGISTRNIEGFDQQCLELVEKNKRITQAMIIDTEGTIIFHNDPFRQGKKLPQKDILSSITTGKTEIYSIEENNDNTYFAVLPFGDEPDYFEYAIVVCSPAKIINDKVLTLINKCNIVLISTFGLAALLLLVGLTTMLTTPLAAILKTMKDITKSRNLEKRVDIKSNDEIGQIATAFNKMTTDLQQSTTSIDNLNREIAERKRAERKLQLTQFSIDNAPDCTFCIEPGGRFSYVNNAACKVFGYSRDEMLSLSVWDIDPNFSEETSDEDWQEIKQKGSMAFESLSKTKDGRLFPVEVSVFYVDFEGHECMWAFSRDISERKKIECELKESDNRFQEIVSNASEWVWEVDSDGLYTYSSPVIEDLLGYKPEEIVGKKHFYDLFVPEDRDEIKRLAFEKSAKKKSFKGFLNANVHKNGQTVWIMTSGVPILDDDGNLIGYRGSDINITQQKEAEEKIKESRKILQDMIDAMPFGVMVIGRDKKIKQANATARQLTGYSEDELLGQLCYQVLCPAEENNCPILDRHQTLDHSERKFITKDKKEVPIIKSVIQLKLGNEDVLLEAFIDITDRKEAEKKLEQLNESLEDTIAKLGRANNELKDFVYIASHDLREPMRKISSFGELLSDSLKDKLNDDDKENLGFMVDGATRMQQRIDALLTYSRVTTRGAEFETVDLNKVMEELRSVELAVKIEETGAKIATPERLHNVSCDPAQIRQLMQNLIANGLKYQKEGVVPEITIRSSVTDNDMIRVEVTDNGIGIKQEQFKDVFVMFKRLHSRQEYEGAGIGLAVCKKIVVRHGGDIGVSSTYGQGATFWFTLPALKTPVEKQLETSVALRV